MQYHHDIQIVIQTTDSAEQHTDNRFGKFPRKRAPEEPYKKRNTEWMNIIDISNAKIVVFSEIPK